MMMNVQRSAEGITDSQIHPVLTACWAAAWSPITQPPFFSSREQNLKESSLAKDTRRSHVCVIQECRYFYSRQRGQDKVGSCYGSKEALERGPPLTDTRGPPKKFQVGNLGRADRG